MHTAEDTYTAGNDIDTEPALGGATLRALVSPLWKRVRAHLPGPVRFALRQLLFEVQVARRHRAGFRQAQLRVGDPPRRLNLACGHINKAGWLNVDLFSPAADVRLDLRRPFPFPDDSADYIYTEHFFEHLEYPNVIDSMGWDLEGSTSPSEAHQFLRECRRVLSSGGTVDVVVPDAAGIIDVYVTYRDCDSSTPWWGPTWCDTGMHRVNYLFRQGRQHKYAYDEETLTRVLQHAGFVDVHRRPFDPQMDAPNHVIGSLCVVGVKP